MILIFNFFEGWFVLKMRFFILSWPYKGFLIVLCWASSKLIYCRYSSSSSNFQSSQRYSSSSSSYKISNIREESEDYTFQENRRKHSGYSKYADDGGLSNGMNGMSLDGLRKPNIDSWDSMGILGLSSKMWNDTSSKKQGYMSSMREESYNSYIMWKIMHLSCIQLTTFLQKITKEEKIKNQTKNVKEKLLLIKVKKRNFKNQTLCLEINAKYLIWILRSISCTYRVLFSFAELRLINTRLKRHKQRCEMRLYRDVSVISDHNLDLLFYETLDWVVKNCALLFPFWGGLCKNCDTFFYRRRCYGHLLHTKSWLGPTCLFFCSTMLHVVYKS